MFYLSRNSLFYQVQFIHIQKENKIIAFCVFFLLIHFLIIKKKSSMKHIRFYVARMDEN